MAKDNNSIVSTPVKNRKSIFRLLNQWLFCHAHFGSPGVVGADPLGFAAGLSSGLPQPEELGIWTPGS